MDGYHNTIEELLGATWECSVFRVDNISMKEDSKQYLKDKQQVKLSEEIIDLKENLYS